MKWLRKPLGFAILTLDRMFSPKSVKRSPEEQKRMEEKASKLALYQFEACPFCVKVRRGMKRLGLNIEIRDVLKDEAYKKELVEQGGTYQVPCLRIQKEDGTTQWMYESDDILAYLQSEFGTQ